MPRMVQCVKLGKEAEAMKYRPFNDELGHKLFESVSQEAWVLWLEHSKMLINEYRLDLVSDAGQRVWFGELDKYFWGDGSKLPDQFKPAEPGAPAPGADEKKA